MESGAFYSVLMGSATTGSIPAEPGSTHQFFEYSGQIPNIQCTPEHNEEDDGESIGSIRSLLTDGTTKKLTVIEYICGMAGVMKNDPNRTPLFYGIERTSKSETDGLYFVLTHQDQLENSQSFIEEDLDQIYVAADTYEETLKQFPKFATPYMGSYQRSSMQIAKEITSNAKKSANNGNEGWQNKKNNATRSSRSGITIDYGEFPKMEKDSTNNENIWTTRQKQQGKNSNGDKGKEEKTSRQEMN